jgi:hypothetical protein
MMAVPGGPPPRKMGESGQGLRSEGWTGARLRAAVDRLHAAQLAALAAGAARERPVTLAAPVPAPTVPAATALAEAEPAPRRDAYRAQHHALAQVDEMGSLLVRLARLGQAEGTEGEAVAIRRRLVQLAVAAATTLAELVGLAFEIESPAE